MRLILYFIACLLACVARLVALYPTISATHDCRVFPWRININNIPDELIGKTHCCTWCNTSPALSCAFLVSQSTASSRRFNTLKQTSKFLSIPNQVFLDSNFSR